MLGISIVIGAFLVPLLYKPENWITDVALEKNNKIRLQAAKKTIAALESKPILELLSIVH